MESRRKGVQRPRGACKLKAQENPEPKIYYGGLRVRAARSRLALRQNGRERHLRICLFLVGPSSLPESVVPPNRTRFSSTVSDENVPECTGGISPYEQLFDPIAPGCPPEGYGVKSPIIRKVYAGSLHSKPRLRQAGRLTC